LSRPRTAATVRLVKYALLLAFALLAACETTRPEKDSPSKKYTKLTVTDPEGDLISEWIAEGRVKKDEQGYIIRAVERRSAPPTPVTTQYPNGRISTIVGPNIVLEDIEKPEWLKKLDGDTK
jgi:hypothetical protein